MSEGSSRPRHIATWNPERRLWETDRLSLFSEHSEPFSETFPTAGMWADGSVYELPTWAPRTDDSESSSQLGLLPTPRTSDTNGAGVHGTGGPDLRTAISLLPTPAAGNFNDGESVESWQARKEREKAKGRNGNGIGTPLAMAVQLLPTPRATDGEKGGPNQRGSSGDQMLPSAVMQLLPTPRAQHGEERNQNIWPRPLDEPQNLENAQARLPGATTAPPSDAGNEPSAA